MITLKAVLVGSSCVGALAIGGVTYATVAHPNAGLRSDDSKAPVAKPAAPAAPAVPQQPKCLPQPGGAPALRQPEAAGKALPQRAESARQAAQQAVEQKAGAARNAPVAQPHTLPKAEPKGVANGAPGTDCLPKNAEPAVPAKPQAPQLPKPAKPTCAALQPAVPVGSPLERSVILARGLDRATKHVSVVEYKSQKLCAVTQKWAGKAGQWLKVERIKTPAYFGVDQAREALRLPEGGVPTTVNGQRGVTTPLGGAVLWYDPEGYALYVSGSPAYTAQLQDVAAKVQQAQQAAR